MNRRAGKLLVEEAGARPERDQGTVTGHHDGTTPRPRCGRIARDGIQAFVRKKVGRSFRGAVVARRTKPFAADLFAGTDDCTMDHDRPAARTTPIERMAGAEPEQAAPRAGRGRDRKGILLGVGPARGPEYSKFCGSTREIPSRDGKNKSIPPAGVYRVRAEVGSADV